MIESGHTKLGVAFFEMYASVRLKRHFKHIYFKGEPDSICRDKPLLVIGNHFSWWDGFIQIVLNKKVFGKRFHVMMLEEQLRKNMILNTCGAFSIKKKSRDLFRSLNYSLCLLSHSNNMVLIFPQGEIQSIYTTPLKFERGLNYLLKRIDNSVQIVFNVNLIDYFSDNKPSLSIYYTTYTIQSNINIEEIEEAFNQFTQSCIKQQLPPH